MKTTGWCGSNALRRSGSARELTKSASRLQNSVRQDAPRRVFCRVRYIKPYHTVSAELTVQHRLLLQGSRIVIPPPLRKKLLATVVIRVSQRAGSSLDSQFGGRGSPNSWKISSTTVRDVSKPSDSDHNPSTHHRFLPSHGRR